jgi:hypothetical protein
VMFYCWQNFLLVRPPLVSSKMLIFLPCHDASTRRR